METNKELESKLVEVISSISDSIGQVKDFAVEQLPDVAQQYILFGMIWEAITLAIFLILSACSIKLVIWGIKKNRTELDYYDRDAGFAAIISGGVGSTVFFVLSIAQIQQVLLVFLAPKLYLIQGLVNLVK
jgi:hypothetical protein